MLAEALTRFAASRPCFRYTLLHPPSPEKYDREEELHVSDDGDINNDSMLESQGTGRAERILSNYRSLTNEKDEVLRAFALQHFKGSDENDEVFGIQLL